MIKSAVHRLDEGGYDAPTIEAARRELLDIQRDLLVKIASGEGAGR